MAFWNRKKSTENKIRWTKVYSDMREYRAEMVRAILEENDIEALIINKQDGSYNSFGEFEVHANRAKVLFAVKIIEDDITFE